MGDTIYEIEHNLEKENACTEMKSCVSSINNSILNKDGNLNSEPSSNDYTELEEQSLNNLDPEVLPLNDLRNSSDQLDLSIIEVKENTTNETEINNSLIPVLDNLTQLSDYCDDVQEDKKIYLTYLKSERDELLSRVKTYEAKVEFLKNTNIAFQNELSLIKTKLQNQEEEFKKSEAEMRSEFLNNIEKLSKECNTLRKEKESMVIRYANSEKEVLLEKKTQNDLEKKLKDAIKDRESLNIKIKNLTIEKNKLSSIIDAKLLDLARVEKENEKLKEDFNSREIKIKWLQNNLKSEISSHKETQCKLEHSLQRLNEMKEEAEQVRRDCQEMIKHYQEAEEVKSVKLDGQLKQKLTELEDQKKEKIGQEQVYQLLRQELETLKKKQRMAMEENNSLTLKIHSLEKERLEYEQTLSKLKDTQNLLRQEVVDLTARLAEMENLQLNLEREKEKSAANLREVERLRLTNAELQADMDACHLKEGELLEFTGKLTAKTVHLQSDHCLLEVKTQALEEELNQLNKQLSGMQKKYLQLATQFQNNQKERQEEIQLVTRMLAEKTKSVEKLNMKLEEAESENVVMKRRHISSIKELTRELSRCKRKLENYESAYSTHAESTSLESRTSSTTSLDHTAGCTTNNALIKLHMSPSIKLNGSKSTPSKDKNLGLVISGTSVECDKKLLIDRIIKLQETLARKNDKIEFLEDHIKQLAKELRKKINNIDFKNI